MLRTALFIFILAFPTLASAGQALAAGHHVTALARSPEKLTITNPNLHVVQGDATDRAAVSQAMKGADAVISTLGAKGSVIAAAARAIVAVAKQEGPQRIVMLSTFAVARDANKFVIKAAVETEFKVTVLGVRVVSVRPKQKRRGRRTMGMVPGWKKAIVTIAPGDKIELFEAV